MYQNQIEIQWDWLYHHRILDTQRSKPTKPVLGVYEKLPSEFKIIVHELGLVTGVVLTIRPAMPLLSVSLKSKPEEAFTFKA